ncbi:MAG: MerR family transcriptional regulator [Halobacteriovoraceae bacterium]|nr:MerR family transcriptional regulator [Halobacteriovoraceae bacterium]MCB9095074.1 MerR family transcriptional regulator [Halobacteriovoraceae bacterium]
MNIETIEITKHSHYHVNEVLERFDIKPYILRFWESEFEQIKPIVSDSGQKLYTPQDLFYIKKIKKLLLEDKLPIQKAKLIVDKDISEKTQIVHPPHEPATKTFQASLFQSQKQFHEIAAVKKRLKVAQDLIASIKRKNSWI